MVNNLNIDYIDFYFNVPFIPQVTSEWVVEETENFIVGIYLLEVILSDFSKFIYCLGNCTQI